MGDGRITVEEMANAEAVLERGGKKKFNGLSTIALLGLCSSVLKINVESLDIASAKQALQQYVSCFIVALYMHLQVLTRIMLSALIKASQMNTATLSKTLRSKARGEYLAGL